MKKTLKISGIILIVILIILIFLVLTPILFRARFAQVVKNTANRSLKTELNFSDMDVSFFRHFPNLSFTLTDLSLKSSAPFTHDTLIKARDVSFGVNLLSLLHGPIRINRVYIDRARVIIQYNDKGLSDFDVYSSSSDTTNKPTAASGGASIKIEDIIFIKTELTYFDPTVPLKIVAHGLNYHGKSNINNDIVRLASKVQIDSLDFIYDRVHYLKAKPVKANLITSINLNSLSMQFERNDLHIKDIPFEFRGEFSLRKDGYTFFISLFSQMGDEYLSGSLWLVSKEHLWISLKADINLNLENWVKKFGVSDEDLKGIFAMKVNADGEYYTGQNPESKKPDTIPLRIPNFTLTSKMSNGYFRYKSLPQAITGISFNLNASSKDNDYKSLNLQVDSLKARFMKNNLEGYFRLKGLKEFSVEGHISTRINLAELRQVIPLDSLDLKGFLDMNLNVNGKYSPLNKEFPVTTLTLSLKDGTLKTKYYPQPLENINVIGTVVNQTGKLADTKIKLDPLSLNFEGNAFELKADLANPDNIQYDIVSKGTIYVGKIYHLFSRKGMDLDGLITTDLSLKGLQSDAMAGHIDKLQNSGRLQLHDIAFKSEVLPKPLIVKSGTFRFDNDKIWFEKFDGRIGASDITLDGNLSNIVNYFLEKNQTLKGDFNFHSDYLLVDELLAAADTAAIGTNGSANPPKQQQQTSGQQSGNVISNPSGVIVIPGDLDIGLKADIKKISFKKLELKDMNASVQIKQGILALKSMNFDMIGCKVNMDATYGSINVNKAYFDFHIKAEDFDIKRAYNEVELFRNLSKSAGKCEGNVSLDYALKGRLDAGMNPVYSSLEGGGVLSLKNVKVKGLKLFTAMSKNLDKEKIKDPHLSKVDLKTTIKNNVITLEKTKLKFAGFRFRVGGQTNFNGTLDLKTRLGLPPLGLVGIPIRVLGTMENPKFKYGRGNSDENVEETEYSDEIPPDMLEKIKNAKEEESTEEPK